MTIEVPLWLQGGTYPARLDRRAIASMWDEGVERPTHFKVTQRGAGANFSVDVAAGVAVVAGDDQAEQGSYIVRSTATENKTVTAAPGSNSRYDLVTLRINDPNAGGNAGNTAEIIVVPGTAAASPTVPALPASSLLLAIIGPIATATASITNALIHDAHTGTGPTGVAAARLIRGDRSFAGDRRGFTGPASYVPNGWLLAYGQAVSRTTYADLFAMYSTTFGVGDGSTTFNLPDYRGRVGVGLDNMGSSDAGRLSVSNTLGGNGGSQTTTPTAGQLGAGATQQVPQMTAVAIGSDFWNVRTADTIVAHDNMPPYILENVIIRT